MSELLELAAEYRRSGLVCKAALKELTRRLKTDALKPQEEIELRRRITLVTAMARECLATSNYLKSYHERRKWLEVHREESGV